MKRFIWILAIVFTSVNLFSQELKISGTVVDYTTGEPLVGAQVKLISSGAVVLTDFDGNFIISADKNSPSEISITYISYQETNINRLQFTKGAAKNLNIKLRKVGKNTSSHNFLAVEARETLES